jgi:hypothetical protein
MRRSVGALLLSPGAPYGQARCTWGYQRHHRRTFCDCVRSQGAPVERLHKPLVVGREVELDQEKSEQAIRKVKRPHAPTASVFCFANGILLPRCRVVALALAKGLSGLPWKSG